jgi:hypothetical protein
LQERDLQTKFRFLIGIVVLDNKKTIIQYLPLSLELPCFSAAGFSAAGSSATSGNTEK